jgi:thiamine-phosphate pyrophosphorylase
VTGPLGSLIVLTDRAQAATVGNDLVRTVREAAAGGADAVVLREKDLAPGERRRLGRAVADALAGTAARLVVASDLDLAVDLGASALHLAGIDPPVGPDRRSALIIGRSCHDREEVGAASREGVDYVTLSPVFATASKPGHGPPLGPGGAAALVAGHHAVPSAYGLGGIDGHNAEACLRAGLSGVAVMGAVMTSPEPGHQVEALREALDRAPERAR